MFFPRRDFLERRMTSETVDRLVKFQKAFENNQWTYTERFVFKSFARGKHSCGEYRRSVLQKKPIFKNCVDSPIQKHAKCFATVKIAELVNKYSVFQSTM